MSKQSLSDKINVYIYFDKACLFKCKHCFLWKKDIGFNTIKTNDWMMILEDIFSLFHSNIRVCLGGDGMSLTEELFFPIIKKCTELGFETELASNCYLINDKILKKLIAYGLDTLVISLDYLTEEKHDLQRGVQGSYRHAIKIIKKSKKLPLKIQSNCIIMKPNLDEIIPLAKKIASINNEITLHFQALVQPFNTECNENWHETFSDLWPNNDTTVLEVLDELIKLKMSGYKIGNNTDQINSFKSYFKDPSKSIRTKCNVKDVSFHIHSNGRLRKCDYMEDIGFINKDNSFKDLIFSNQYKKVTEKMRNCTKNCILMVNCNYEKEKS